MKKICVLVLGLFISIQTNAGDGEEACGCTVSDISKEASYLAKKLLEVTGKSEYSLEQSASSRIMIGACFEISTAGIKLTCITPDLEPEKKGMMTGDVIVEINGISFVGEDIAAHQIQFDQIVKSMQAGDILRMEYVSGELLKTVDIEVQEITHPGFVFKVTQ